MRFYKRDPAAFIDGVEGMSLEEIGAYTLMLDHMYVRGGAIIDSPAVICGMLNCDRRVWNRLRLSLILKGKIVDRGDGFLSNRRVEIELAELADMRVKRAKSGAIGGAKSAEKKKSSPQTYGLVDGEVNATHGISNSQLTASDGANGLGNKESGQASATASATAKSKQIEIEIVEASSLRSEASSPSSNDDGGPSASDEKVVDLHPKLPVKEAVEAYNRMAEAQGWSRCREVTPGRRTTISARLRKRGLDGWKAALTLASKADWVNDPDKRSREHKSWKPSIDWFARDKTQVQLLETADDAAMREIETPERWTERLDYLRDKNFWFAKKWGPRPGEPGCRVPAEILRDRAG